jgi:hypothetical protein
MTYFLFYLFFELISFLTPIYDHMYIIYTLHLHHPPLLLLLLYQNPVPSKYFFIIVKKKITSFLRGKIQNFPTPSLWPYRCSLYVLYHHWCLWCVLYYPTFIHSSNVSISHELGVYYDCPCCNWRPITELFLHVFDYTFIFIMFVKFLWDPNFPQPFGFIYNYQLFIFMAKSNGFYIDIQLA